MIASETLHLSTSRTNTSTASNRKDRKSTRLNSSHSQISYAVFCLKKKIAANNSLDVRQPRVGHRDTSLSLYAISTELHSRVLILYQRLRALLIPLHLSAHPPHELR